MMNSPATARRGNQVSATGMSVAILTTFVVLIHDRAVTATGWAVLFAGAAVGGALGLFAARRVAMTAMPQLVSIFNAVGGAAAGLLAINELLSGHELGSQISITGALDILIGAVTFS